MAKTPQQEISQQIHLREAQVESFVLRLQRILDKSFSRVIGGKEKPSLQTLSDIERVLDSNGYPEQLKKLRSIYATEVLDVKSNFEIDAFSGSDKTVVDTLISSDFSRVTTTLDAHVADTKALLTRAVIVPQRIDLAGIVDGESERVASYLNTELNTMLSAFNQTVTLKKADELGFNLFLYLGPDDKKTRDFCDHLLKKSPAIYSRDEITRMDNDQGLDVFTYRGGYNCRHQWRPISEEKAKAQGWKGS